MSKRSFILAPSQDQSGMPHQDIKCARTIKDQYWDTLLSLLLLLSKIEDQAVPRKYDKPTPLHVPLKMPIAVTLHESSVNSC